MMLNTTEAAMIDGSFSLFGFDLLGPNRRARREADRKKVDGKAAELARNGGEAGPAPEREFSTTFLWGMYPHY
jgi:hypothetical protein